MWIRPAALVDAAALLGSGVGAAIMLGLRTLRGTPQVRPVEQRTGG